MINYSIKEAARKVRNFPKGTEVILPRIEDRLSSYRDYLKVLRAMIREMTAEVRESIIPLYRADIARRSSGDYHVGGNIRDAAAQEWFLRLRALAVALSRRSDETVQRVLRLEAERHTATFMATAKRALGVDLAAVVRDEDLAGYLQEAAARNASLIKNLSEDIVNRVEQAVINNSIAGNSVATLKKQLEVQFGIVGRRAELIAYDQTSKLNSDLNRIRHQQAGVDEYDWSTSADERVRPLHRSLEGKRYKYGEPTGAEGGLPPGQPVRCRCVALGVVVF